MLSISYKPGYFLGSMYTSILMNFGEVHRMKIERIRDQEHLSTHPRKKLSAPRARISFKQNRTGNWDQHF